MNRGKYIVIEGAPGVGKTTLIQLVLRQLQAAQLPVRVMREPASQDDLTARAIRRITQDPRYPMTTRTEVLLYNAARSQSVEVIRSAIEQGVTCLVDRSYLTTLAIQYYGRGDVQDYQKINDIVEFAIGDMRPDLMIVLDAPVSTLRERAKQRAGGERFDNLDESFLERVRAGYLWEAKQRNLPVVYANEGIETVFKDVWQHIASCLAVRDKDAPDSGVQSVAEVLAAKPATKVAAVEPPLHGAVLDNAPAEPDDPPASTPDSDAVVQLHGQTDIAPQLAGIHLTIPDITKLAANLLDWGQVTHLEQHPIGFDHKEASGQYRYYTPDSLGGKLRNQYVKTMDQIFGNYTTILEATLKHLQAASPTPKSKRNAAWLAALSAEAHSAAQAVLPLAAKTTVGIFASAEAVQDLITRLQHSDQTELRHTGDKILAEARNGMSDVFGHGGKPKQSAATNAHAADSFGAVQKMVQELLPPNYADSQQPARLASYSPHNELDIVADMLYQHSDLPLTQLQQEVAGWPYQRKLDVFGAYIGGQLTNGDKPSSILGKVHYNWDLISGFDVYCDFASRYAFTGLAWQIITPRIGYETPALIEEAGLSDLYDQCFDLSLQLHSALQAGNISPADAQYAALVGHKLRWQVTYSAADAFDLHKTDTAQSTPTYRSLVQQMHEKLAEVHPLLAEAIKPAS